MKPSKKNSVVQISHPEKVFWPEEGYTKGDLAIFIAKSFPGFSLTSAEEF